MDTNVSVAMPKAMTTTELDQWSNHWLAVVEDALSNWISPQAPAGLGEAMRYAVLDGGKRLRPLLVLAAREAVAAGEPVAAAPGLDDAALRADCAAELIHAYSLVHDDMPCMDNDVLRRGKPTVHVQFGEAQALLAGDALQTLAFEILTPQDGSVAASAQAACVALLSRASGYQGMAGGQAIDLASVGKPLTETELLDMHSRKTGALLQNSVLMGAACGEGIDADAFFAEVTTSAPYRDLSRHEFDRVLDFVSTGGYALRTYERFRRIVKMRDGLWRARTAEIAAQNAELVRLRQIEFDEKLAARLRTEHVCIASASRERHPFPPALAAWIQGG